MPEILDGKKLAEKLLSEIKTALADSQRKLRLACVLVGKDSDSLIFVAQKEKAGLKAGIDFKLYSFPKETGFPELADKVGKICDDPQNDGVIIQLPLPEHIDADKILNLIPAEKDVDSLSGKNPDILSPVAAGIKEFFKEYGISAKKKKAAVVGRGRLVGRPAAEWLEKQGAEVSIIDKSTPNPSSITREADIVVSATGVPGLITGDMIKEGAVVLDAGRDVDFQSVSLKAGFVSPVPGGLGPLTVALVLRNLLILNGIKI